MSERRTADRMELGHNGGPDLFDDDSDPIRMRVIRIHINDWVASTRGLSLEEEGFFWRFTLLLYDRMGVLVDDDGFNARAMSLDVRSYKRNKRRLVELGKIQIEEGRLSHPRIEREIELYLAEHRRRQGAAKEREARKRELNDAFKLNPADFRRTSGELPAEVQPIFAEMLPELTGDLSKKPSVINGCNATTLPQEACSHARLPKPKPLREVSTPLSPPEGGGHDSAPLPDPLDEAFEDFWRAFPTGRKLGKGNARETFRKIVLGRHRQKLHTKASVLVEAARAYAATRPDPQYTPMPSTWLNDGRWEDDASRPPPPPPPTETAVWDEFRRARELDEQMAT